jgi:hypothetical protein
VYRIIKDTAIYVDTDSTTRTRQLVRDTTYYIPVHFKENISYLPTYKESVYAGEDLNKGIALLTKWIKDHPKYFKPRNN